MRGPDALERAAVAMCTLTVLVFAVGFGIHQVRMAESIEAVSLVSGTPEYNLMEYRALYGRWPSRSNASVVGDNATGKYVRDISLDRDGVLTANIDFVPVSGLMNSSNTKGLKPRIDTYLSFRPLILGSGDAKAFMFLCGNASPPASNGTLYGENRTTLTRVDSPPDCR